MALPETEECSWLSEIVLNWECETDNVHKWTGLEEAKQACYGMGVECSAVWCRGAYSGQAMQCTPYTYCTKKALQKGSPAVGTVIYKLSCKVPEHCYSPCYETEEHTNGTCRNVCDCTGPRVCYSSSSEPYEGYCVDAGAVSNPVFDYPACLEGDDCIFDTFSFGRYGCLDSSPGALQPTMQHDNAKRACLTRADCIGYLCETGEDRVVRCLVLTQELHDCMGDNQKPFRVYTAYRRCCGTHAKEQCPKAWAEHLADIATPHPHYTPAPPTPPIVTGLATIGGLAVFVAAITVWLAYRSDLRAVRDEAPDQGQELVQAEPQDEDDVVLA